MLKSTALTLLFFPGAAAFGQESASYQLKENVQNAGGVPEEGAEMSSASFRLSLDAIGQGVAAPEMTSAGYSAGTGFVPPYPPPGEVQNLRFNDLITLEWDPESSIGSYTLYRGDISSLGSGYGSCAQSGLENPFATEGSQPTGAYFYIVAAENRLAEEGSLGQDSSGAPRSGVSCP
jgi:hypothetical protein